MPVQEGDDAMSHDDANFEVNMAYFRIVVSILLS